MTRVGAGRVHPLGVRHHGPGSARSLVAALDRLRPDAVLVEGPSDADPLLPLAADAGMRPPVALLAYAADDPGHSAFWPFATFSPEWQAVTWAQRHGVPVGFCDLPAAVVLAGGADLDGGGDRDGDGGGGGGDGGGDGVPRVRRAGRVDPLAMLASAAGYDDPERWWDDVIEHRAGVRHRSPGDGAGGDGAEADPFAAIAEAMTELRSAGGEGDGTVPPDRDARREAYMRTRIRAVLAAGASSVAVVCGAWHVPAVGGRLPSAASDTRVLRGLPKRKVSLTWVPWTHSRLAVASGYGAGVTSPGWYQHLFRHPEQTVTRWMTSVARELRREDLPVSSADVIDAVRTAEALATLRGRPLAGLDEVMDATRAALVGGDEVALALVTDRLVVGEALGAVPVDTPAVPLEADLRARARACRLRFEATERVLDLDLRSDGGRARSQLLHRLTLLRVPWGVPAVGAVRATGTFRETWRLVWQPELSVSVVEAATWGTTVEAAASARLREVADRAGPNAATLPELTEAVRSCLLAGLSQVLAELLAALDRRAAVEGDLEHLTGALPALVRGLRYGDVRGTDTTALARVADTILTRICLGLPTAAGSLDDSAAQRLRESVDAVHAAVALRADPSGTERWLSALSGLIDRPDVHGLLVGRLVRILFDAGRLAPEQAATRLSRALSAGVPAAAKAAWVEGFLSGGGLLLVHDRHLLGLLDEWVCGLAGEQFVDVLPLLRRTFGSFAEGERRGIGERVRHGDGGPPSSSGTDVDHRRAALALTAVERILGLDPGAVG